MMSDDKSKTSQTKTSNIGSALPGPELATTSYLNNELHIRSQRTMPTREYGHPPSLLTPDAPALPPLAGAMGTPESEISISDWQKSLAPHQVRWFNPDDSHPSGVTRAQIETGTDAQRASAWAKLDEWFARAAQ
ncbi:hypothetical protein D3C77_225170 [compost metagenome]|uniref:Uncharacterized protein n=1 Tax=Pseudomonas wadenswilerensis TaxID=1785161 RepID=A0A380SV36_9PSED|nr:hypothetical protein CCOS864_00523 [Pseudomonas wadenswilerensis]